MIEDVECSTTSDFEAIPELTTAFPSTFQYGSETRGSRSKFISP